MRKHSVIGVNLKVTITILNPAVKMSRKFMYRSHSKLATSTVEFPSNESLTSSCIWPNKLPIASIAS